MFIKLKKKEPLMSTFREQKKYLEFLKKFENKMEEKEKQFYKMCLSRDKEEEEFEKETMEKLKAIYDKYKATNKPKIDPESLFKKND